MTSSSTLLAAVQGGPMKPRCWTPISPTIKSTGTVTWLMMTLSGGVYVHVPQIEGLQEHDVLCMTCCA